jgi:hypothetical protein
LDCSSLLDTQPETLCQLLIDIQEILLLLSNKPGHAAATRYDSSVQHKPAKYIVTPRMRSSIERHVGHSTVTSS